MGTIPNLTTFTEIDPSGNWSQTSSRNTASAVLNSEVSYLYKDYGSVFGDFYCDLDVHITSIDTGSVIGLWSLGNVFGDWGDMSNDAISLWTYATTPGSYRLYLKASNVPGSYQDYDTLFPGNTYYLKVERNASTATCKIYPTALDRTNDTNRIDTLSVNCNQNLYRYLQAGFSYGSVGSLAVSGYIENIEHTSVPDVAGSETVSLSDDIFLKPTTEFLRLEDTPSLSDNIQFFETTHSGTISSNETWKASDNPHAVIGNITVATGVTLTIEAGCEIYFTGQYSINAGTYGIIHVDGTAENPVLFTSVKSLDWWSGTPAKADWGRLVCDMRFTDSYIRYATVEYAGASNYTAVRGFTEVSNCIIRECTAGGIYAYYSTNGNDAKIEYNTIYNVGDSSSAPAIKIERVDTGDTLTVKHNLIYNFGAGFSANGIEVPSSRYIYGNLDIYNNTIVGNPSRDGIKLFGVRGNGNITVHNNIITDSNRGFYWLNSGTIILDNDYNDYDNCTTDVSGTTIGGNSLTVDPIFINPGSDDYRIGASSPLVSVGNPVYETYMGYATSFLSIIQEDTLVLSDQLNILNQLEDADAISLNDTIEIYSIDMEDISNKIAISKGELIDIDHKINTAVRNISDCTNHYSSVNGGVLDMDNDIRTLAETTDNVSNDIRTLLASQVPGDAGFQSLGKEYIKVYIASVEQTDVTVDSISITKVLNGTHTASFELGRAYDNTKPAIESSVEIKYDNWVLYRGYITEITPSSSPEAIIINCKDNYWKNNRTKKYFFTGRKPRDNKEKYYSRISTALSNEYSWSPGIGSFIPQTMSSFGTGYSDALTSLITNAGNFAWYYDVEGNKKLWTAGQGDIINLERQTIGTNLGLYQVLLHQFKDSISNIVNKLRVQMGNKVIRKFNPTGATKDYQSSSYIIASVALFPAWDAQYEVLAKDSENGYGWDWRDPDKDTEFKKVFTKYSLPFLDPDKAKWTDRFPLRVEIIKPLAFGSWELSVPEGSLTEGFTVDYENQELIFNDPVYLLKKDSNGRVEEIRVPSIILWINKEVYNSNTEDESDDPESDISNEFMFFTPKMGTYPITVMGSLQLSNFSIQRGYTYINWEDDNWWDTKVVVPSWNDTAFAKDFANWQLSKTADKKVTGLIEVTLDTACVYDIQLNKRIMIDGVMEDSLNIQSISYNIGSFTASIQLENGRYYRRNVSIPSHGE